MRCAHAEHRGRRVAARVAAWVAIGVLGLACACRCKHGRPADDWTQPAPPVPQVSSVWVVDDSVRVGRRDGPRPILAGTDNPVWSPGAPVSLFALPGETVALQVGVTADAAALAGVTVDLGELTGPAAIRNRAAGAPNPRHWHPIERFVVHDLTVERRSGGKVAGESLGWYEGAQPPDEGNRGSVPDPLIPIALAPAWADYPMTVAPGEHRVVWIDLTLADELPAGDYRGVIRVAAGDRALAAFPVELTVGGHRLPYAAVSTMLYYDPGILGERVGPDAAVHHLQLVHRHHITPFAHVNSLAELERRRPQLSGALFTAEHGYQGAGAGRGQDVIALGTYGSLGDPGTDTLATVEGLVAALATAGWQGRDVFLYAVDEQCESPRAPRWRELLDGSASAEARALRVGHTCSDPPAEQPVDLAIVFSSTYDPKQAAAARAAGKRVWVYNGMLPRVGSFLTDGEPLSLRANAWLQALYGIERWFYWESVFWADGNRGGHGPYDPLARAETFHNQHGDHANGDGVLVYPGQQRSVDFEARSLGFDGVVASFRLKQWRRGIQDAGYLQLARAVDRAAADRIARDLIGVGFADAPKQGAPSWPRDGARWTEARRALFELIESEGGRARSP